MAEVALGSGRGYVFRQRSLYVALVLWILLCVAAYVLAPSSPRLEGAPGMRSASTLSSIYLVLVILAMGLASLLARHRAFPNLAERAPDRATALKEIVGLWAYVAVVLVAGQFIGRYFFGAGIALHLNGSLMGATRVQSPPEVFTWAAYNGILLALVPYVAFRLRGYSNADPTSHVFESWTQYASVAQGAASLMLVFLTFLPAGLMKSFLTMRTGNAWVHLWAYHAISPHVTIDTRLIVHDFNIK